MRSPLVGGWGVARSTNAADSELYNLFPEYPEEQSSAKSPWLQMCPGLNLVKTVGAGPIRGLHVFNTLLYIVSGAEVYSMNSSGTLIDLGPIAAGSTPVTMFDNAFQLIILDGTGVWLIPGGNPLAGATINNAGINYSVNDVIRLSPNSGTAFATPILKVLTIGGGGAVATFSILQAGAISTAPANLSQLSTTGAGSGFTVNAATYGAAVTLVPIYTPIPVPTTGTVVDNFGLVAKAGTNQLNQSKYLDLSVWDPLDFAVSGQHTQGSDFIQKLHDINDELFVIKLTSTEVWVNAGLPGFAFQPLTGVHLEVGTIAPETVKKAGSTLVWLARNDEGFGEVIQVRGYTVSPVSTQAQVAEFTGYSNLGDAVAYSYQQAGHVFYVLTFPTASKTWVLDLTASALAKQPQWHRRATWSGGVWTRHPVWLFANFVQSVASGLGCVGDATAGKIYSYDLTQLLDNGAGRRWLRSFRALPQPREETTRFCSLRLDLETGASAGSITLRWSDDGGHTFTTGTYSMPVNPLDTSVKFNRLGTTRRHAFTDRIFEISSTDAFKVALIGAEVDIGEATTGRRAA